MVQKKVPMRQCLGCREMFPKRELIRVVRSPEGELSLDFKGKAPGRGAYLCGKPECLKKARKSRDELVREACFDHKTRCVFIAGDAGANAAKKAAFYADKANVPCVTLPHGKLELGSAIGKAGCAMCAVADIGMAAAAVNKLAEQDPAYAEVAQQLSEKNVKIQSRRGVKKHKDKAEKTEEAPVKTEKSAEEKPKRTYRKPSGEKRPYRKNDENKRPYRKADGDKRPFRKEGEYRPYRKNDGEKRPFRKDGERRPYRKSGAGKPSFNSGKRSFRNKT